VSVANNIVTVNSYGTTVVGVLEGASASISGNITSSNFIGTLNGSGANVTSISATNISSGTLAQARLANAAVTLGSTALTLGATVTTVAGLTSVTSTTFVGALTGAATTAGTVTTAAQANITSVGTLTALTVTGNVTGGNLITAGLVSLSSITKTGSNGVGNIGSSTSVFNTVFAKATSAQYADLAENYLADNDYPVGTVLIIGGDAEVTQSISPYSLAIAGTVSENPATIMNAGLKGEHVTKVALVGRVPCRVKGTITKGDLLTSSELPGVAKSVELINYVPGCVIGKALQNYSNEHEGIIEILVGRL
jgi:hypothetical protein